MAHLSFVVLGALSLDPWSKLGKIGMILTFYGEATGASSGYGFFAPGVGSQLRSKFFTESFNGITAEALLANPLNRESDLRLGNLVGWFWNDRADRKIQRSLAASWAGKIFGDDPGARTVTVRLESYYLPSMKQYREGQRPDWRFFYEAKFLKKKQDSPG